MLCFNLVGLGVKKNKCLILETKRNLTFIYSGPIGTYHQQGNILRSVENGFTLFRCVSQGVSGIFEPTLNSVFNQKVGSNNVEKYIFYLPIQKRLVTLYGYIGDSFGYVCLIASVALLLKTYRDNKRQHQLQI